VDKESEAKDIIARLKKDPGAFSKLAMDRSKDPGSKAQGGDLGWFDPSGMVPEFGAAVSKLEKGKFTRSRSRPIRLPRDPARRFQAGRCAAAERRQAQLTQQLQQQNLRKQLDALKAGAKIEIVAASPAPAPAAPAPPVPAAPAPAPAK
jgi:peptidyl-prolyl cis-trans isomerase C